MDQQFYQFAMTFRDPYKKDPLVAFANKLDKDLGFPRNHSDYYVLADYLELSGDYSEHMANFDDMFDQFKERKEQANKTLRRGEE